MFEETVSEGAQLNERLRRAVARRKVMEVEHLLSLPNVDVKYKLNDGNNLLHITSHPEIAKVLLIKGADINEKNSYGETPLLKAIIEKKPIDVIKEFLKHGADTNAPNSTGVTPLECAMCIQEDRSLTITRLLIEYGAEICNPTVGGSCLDLADRDWKEHIIKFYIFFNCHNFKQILFEPIAILPQFVSDCNLEIHHMKKYKLPCQTSLYHQLLKRDNILAIHRGEKIFQYAVLNHPIYFDFIITRLGPNVERGKLYYELRSRNLQIIGDHGLVKLNSNCLLAISSYLSNTDVQSLLKVSYKDATLVQANASAESDDDDDDDFLPIKIIKLDQLGV